MDSVLFIVVLHSRGLRFSLWSYLAMDSVIFIVSYIAVDAEVFIVSYIAMDSEMSIVVLHSHFQRFSLWSFHFHLDSVIYIVFLHSRGF